MKWKWYKIITKGVLITSYIFFLILIIIASSSNWGVIVLFNEYNEGIIEMIIWLAVLPGVIEWSLR